MCSPSGACILTTNSLPLLLGSASPRRRQLINLLGLPVAVAISPADEDALQATYRGPVEKLGQWTAEQKARAIHTLPQATDHIVITADTTVILDDHELGKPRDKEHARQLLLSLRNRWHHVITGVVVSAMVAGNLRMQGESCDTPVLMRNYSEEEIEAYIASGDPMDKAGAYGVQNPLFQPTARINGCYLNVVGLPVCTLVSLLAEFNVFPVARQPDGATCPWSEQCQKR